MPASGSIGPSRLPAVTLGLTPLALLARTTRAGVLDVLNADFIRTAHSKGMSSAKVVRWHVARNALVLIVTTIGLQFGSLMSASPSPSSSMPLPQFAGTTSRLVRR